MIKKTVSFTCKSLIFDMDGTMVNNMMVHHRAWQIKLKELGMHLTIEEVIRDVHGVNDEIIKRLFGERFTHEETQKIAWDKEAKYRKLYADDVKLVPGLENFLKQARTVGIPMGIGTAAPEENLEFTVEALNLQEYFSVFVHAGHVKKGKPDPEVFKIVAQKLNIPLKESLVFEDSPTGAKAAENGGAQSIILTSTHTESDFDGIPSIGAFAADFSSFSIEKAQQADSFTVSCIPQSVAEK